MLGAIDGAFVEDKGLTLSIHYRQAADREAEVRHAVHEAAEGRPALKVTEGKMVLEVRPRVEWDKGRAVLFLLDQMRPPEGAPVLYLGDDRTDEDAFRALEGWSPSAEGVLIADPPPAGKRRAVVPARSGGGGTMVRGAGRRRVIPVSRGTKSRHRCGSGGRFGRRGTRWFRSRRRRCDGARRIGSLAALNAILKSEPR